VALSRIRAAQTAGAGQLNQLPCGTVSGSVDATGTLSYTVDVYYLNADPRGRALDDTWIAANQQTCGAAVTSYALLRSTGTDGTDGTASRQLWGTYAFRTSNAPIPGG